MGPSSSTANHVSLVIFGYFLVSIVLFILMTLVILRRQQPRPGGSGVNPQPPFQKGERWMFLGFIGGLLVVMVFAIIQLVFNIRI